MIEAGLARPTQEQEIEAARAEIERAHRRLACYAQASRALGSSLDHDQVLRALVRTAIPELADHCLFHVAVGGEILERPLGPPAGRRRAEGQPARRLERPRLDWSDGRHPVVRALRTGEAQFLPELCGAERQEILNMGGFDAQLGGALSSLMTVPLRGRERTLGALTLCFGESNRHHSQEDLRLAEDLAARAASAIDGARLHEDARRAAIALDRERARLEAVRRSQLVLIEVGLLLAGSLDYEVTLRRIAELAVPALADQCLIHMPAPGERDDTPSGVPNGQLHRVAQASHEPGALVHRPSPIETRQLRSDNPLLIVLRTGKSLWIREVTDEHLAAAAEDPQHLSALRAARPRSMIHAPLVARGQTLGIMTLVSGASKRQFDESDVAVAEELAQRAAWAVDSALQHEAAERARRRSEEVRAQSEAADRLTDAFLATISHELRAPMAALLLWESILRSAQDETMRARALTAIRQSAADQLKLIEELLDISRCASGKLRIERSPVAVAPAVVAALDAALPLAAAKGLQIECSSGGQPAHVLGDAARLQQIVGNLLSNAVKFTDEGGRITVRVECSGSRIEIAVSDTGRGIAPSLLPDLFKPFSRANGALDRAQAGLGLGLGLAIVWQLVDMHEGSVRAESAGEGRGSTFTVSIPRLELDDADRAAAAPRPAGPAESRGRRASAGAGGRPLEGLRVLVVDDEPRVREAIELVLRDAGARVTAASSVAEAFAALQRGRWDVVISDIGMPGEDGYSFVRRLRRLPAAQGGDVAAVALTAGARAQDKALAAEAGFDLHLTKPVDAGQLVHAVASVAAGAETPVKAS
jgi:signal transduction histidine kinase/CheY-like chemotaxis protein